MILLNTGDARALLSLFDGRVPDRGQLDTLAALHKKLRNHEHLIAVCEASVSRPEIQPKEPA